MAAPEGPFAGRLGYMLGREFGGQVLSDWEDAYYAAGPYSHLGDSTNVGAGKEFTPLQKQMIIQENMTRNGGVVKSDLSGEVLVKKTGAYNPNEYQIDHRWPKSFGGSNSYGNAQVLSAAENRAKWSRLPW